MMGLLSWIEDGVGAVEMVSVFMTVDLAFVLTVMGIRAFLGKTLLHTLLGLLFGVGEKRNSI